MRVDNMLMLFLKTTTISVAAVLAGMLAIVLTVDALEQEEAHEAHIRESRCAAWGENVPDALAEYCDQ